MTRSSHVLAALLAPAAAFLIGCGGPPTGARFPREGAQGAVAPVADDKFAETVRELLAAEPRSEDRRVLLSQTIARQMVRANAHFEARAPERGLAAVTGALALASAGELDAASFGPAGKSAMTHAARELSSRGDEGGSFAAYSILSRLVPEAERKEHDAHMAAIARWLKDLAAGGGPMESAQTYKNAAIARAVLEPSDQAVKEATLRTTQWLDAANEIRARYRGAGVVRTPVGKERQEAILAHVALRSAPQTIAALYLRNGDPKGASSALGQARAQDFAPQLSQVVEAVASKPSAERWLELLRALQPEERDEVEASLAQLLRVAQFRVAAEAYRLDPTVLDSAGEVAIALMEFDMLEAAPAVIVAALKAHPDPRAVASAMGLMMQAMMRAPDGDASRRVYRAGAPLLDVADAIKTKTQPSPSTVRALMGEIELRDGHVAEARALLHKAATAERTGPVSATLARIARSEGKGDEALSHLNEALRSPESQKSASLRGEILLMTSDILRERGQAEPARNALADALRGLADARKVETDGDNKARVERTLSKVLDRFGANQKAKQALERAFDASPRDKQEASATLLTMASRALLQNDLATAREDLRRGVAADLPPDDLVYLALWVRLVERQRKSTSDPLVERTFASIKDDGRWTGRLAAFGQGKLKVQDLLAAAKTPAQKTEALFYTAMEQRIAGDAKGAEGTLQKVVQSSGGIELMEVTIARELLSGQRATVSGPVPDVGLP